MSTRTEREWEAFAEAALARASAASRCDPTVDAARAHVASGDFASAASAIAHLAELELAVFTIALSLEACRRGADGDVQAPLFDQLDLRLRPGTPAGDFDRAVDAELLGVWARAADGKLPTTRIASVLARGRSPGPQLCALAAERAQEGRLDDARIFEYRLPPLDKRSRATALAHIGLAERRAGLDAERTLLRAAKLAHAARKIQDGGEEAEALGDTLAVLARGGVAADDPAVVHIVDALAELLWVRAPRDACSWGVVTAIEACSLRAREPAWRAIAENLLQKLREPNHQNRAQRAIAAALGEPLPVEAPDASVEARYAEAVVAGDDAGADAILSADPNAERRARARAAERLLALGREADAIAFVTWSDVNAHVRFDAFCVVARGIREPASLDGLIRARPTLPEWLEDAGAFAVAKAAARLGATRAQIETIATRLDGITRREARLEAFGRLASACEPAHATELIVRGLLTAPTERLFDPVAVAVASAHAWMRAGDAAKAAEVLWETHRPVSRAWILAAEATHDLALARKLFDVAVGAVALTWVTEAMRHDPLFTTPPFAPLGRMLAWLPDDEADTIEERLLTVLDVPHDADKKVASFIAGRVVDPTAVRHRPSWLARWPSPSPPLIAALAPWLVAEFAPYESMLGEADAHKGHPARKTLAVELARAGRVDEALACTQPLGVEGISVLLSVADAAPSSTAAIAKAARKIKKSRDTGDKATWYRVNIELALREGDLDGAIALLGKAPLAYGVDAAVAVARAIAESPAPSARLLAWLRAVSSAPPLEAFGILAGGLPNLIAVADADVRAEAAPIVASLFPRISASDAAAVEVVGLIGEVRAGRATVQALSEAVGRSGSGFYMERWFGRVAAAIVRTPASAQALRVAFAITRTWAPREAAQALSNLAAIMPPQSFVDTLRDARIPSGASRMTIQLALPTLARDPEAIAACVALHPDDEPLVRAAIAWLAVARTPGV